ncbi:hypothetical protein [Streptomyces flavofungini]|uniref:hypothetical protein n=1 Tax=Streptomyces flavofungini TaxID=68200 RepID=UPI0034DF498F
MSIAKYFTGVLSLLSVMFVRWYRFIDNLLVGSAPVWEQAAARRHGKGKAKVHSTSRVPNGRLVAE